jgi:hypothetical protein
MKLKKLIVIEISILVVVLFLILAFVEIAPYLGASKQKDTIGLYSEREFARGRTTLAVGETIAVNFTYPSYDPAILTLDITFLFGKSPGYLTLRCNHRIFASIFVTQENTNLSFVGVSFSGRDWVEPPSSMFGLNEIAFESDSNNGYAGTLSYKISSRGSR